MRGRDSGLGIRDSRKRERGPSRWLAFFQSRIPNPESRRHRNRAQFNLRGRLQLVVGTLGLYAVALVGRAVDLQLIDNAFYQKDRTSTPLKSSPQCSYRI